MMPCRSYWTWAFLTFLIVVNQGLGVGEKFWIKVSRTGGSLRKPELTVFDRSGAMPIPIPIPL